MDAGQLILRAVQLLFVILLTALLGNVIAENNDGNMSAINYALFATILAWLACLLGLAAAFVGSLSSGIFSYILLGLDGLSVLFTFVAAIVLPAKLHAVNCGGGFSNRSAGWIGFGSDDDEKRCRELQASTAFMWFLFVTLIASFALAALSSGRRFGGGGSSAHSSGPHMSQVRV